ncbi:MAG: Lin0512 family protein [Candidatus Hermodarchaeota archaeon]
MDEKRFIVQLAMGTDQHGHNDNCTNAAIKAVKNAISNNCLTGLIEICGLKTPKELLGINVHVKIGAPYPESVDEDQVLKAVPFGQKTIEVVNGGLIAKGILIEALGDSSDKILICNAAVTVSVDAY